MKIRVVSRRWNGVKSRSDENVVYVGRPGRFGNPFEIGVDGNRRQVIEKFEKWISERPYLIDELAALSPDALECWCAPLACHGDVYKRLLEERG